MANTTRRRRKPAQAAAPEETVPLTPEADPVVATKPATRRRRPAAYP